MYWTAMGGCVGISGMVCVRGSGGGGGSWCTCAPSWLSKVVCIRKLSRLERKGRKGVVKFGAVGILALEMQRWVTAWGEETTKEGRGYQKVTGISWGRGGGLL
ncbi:hypothetical protein BDZ91DRAFT_351648 [Kalaharituber pfeilii]|nr:hypothetical protein BDZ91DRAFT_351648 [Kalaharituber pfeilii]